MLPLLKYTINLTPKTQQEVLDELGLSLSPSSTLAQLLSTLPERQPSVTSAVEYGLSRSLAEHSATTSSLTGELGVCLTPKLDQMLARERQS